MQIFCRIGCRTLTLTVEPQDTIQTIKEKIQKIGGISVYFQRLIFAGKVLEDDKALYEYNIQKESTIHLIENYNLFCYIVYGDDKKLKIEGYSDINNNILYLKKRIEEDLGIKVEHQELIFKGKVLQDNETILSNNIKVADEIQLKLK